MIYGKQNCAGLPGGLDTSVAIKWLKDTYDADIVAVCIDMGANKNLEATRCGKLCNWAPPCAGSHRWR